MWWIVASLLLLIVLSWLGKCLLPEARKHEPRAPSDVPPDLEYPATIGDELDLHGVPPRDVRELVAAFIDDALQRQRRRVQIVHGKGTGTLRRMVRELLANHPGVERFADAPPPRHWGVTVVELRAPVVDPDSASE